MYIEWIIAIAIVLIVVAVVCVLKLRSSKNVTIDSIVGEKCIVTETIDNFAGCGQIKVRGQLWSARGFYEDDIFECGESLRIVAIEGVKAVCKKD